MALEIEYRARLSEEQFAVLAESLRQHGEDLGPDDKHIWFYVLPGKLLKVVRNVSSNSGKVVMKANRIGSGAVFPETELPIAAADVATAVQIFDALGFAPYAHDAYNKRHNWRFRGVDIAMKISDVWGHHAEFEVALPDDATSDQVKKAERLVRSVAVDLGVRLMTEDELTEFTRQFESAQAAGAAK